MPGEYCAKHDCPGSESSERTNVVLSDSGATWRARNRIGSETRLIALVAVMCCAIGSNVIAQSVTYTYDATGRLGTAWYDNGTCIAYTYDPSGNRTSQTNANVTGASAWGSAPWGCFDWTGSQGQRGAKGPDRKAAHVRRRSDAQQSAIRRDAAAMSAKDPKAKGLTS
jgi:hypothetical protein